MSMDTNDLDTREEDKMRTEQLLREWQEEEDMKQEMRTDNNEDE
jgi:hypothetical protein